MWEEDPSTEMEQRVWKSMLALVGLGVRESQKGGSMWFMLRKVDSIPSAIKVTAMK